MNCYEIVTKGKTVSRRHKSIFSTLALFLALCNVGVAEEKNAEKKPLDTIEKSSSVTVDSNVEGKKQQPVTLKNVVLAQFLAWYKVGEGGATAEESDYLDLMEPTPENTPTYSGTCEDLHPIKDLDDLLFQIYHHLDDDCLYVMPMAELSDKLGIQVISHVNDNGDFNYKNFGEYTEYFNKMKSLPFKNVKNAIFLRKNMSVNEKLANVSIQNQRKNSRKNSDAINKLHNYINVSYQIHLSNEYLNRLGVEYEKNFFKKMKASEVGKCFSPLGNLSADSNVITRERLWSKSSLSSGYYFWYGYTYSYLSYNKCNEYKKTWFTISFSKDLYIL